MKTISVEESSKVDVDFQRPGMAMTAWILQPVIFKEGDTYCCALGENLDEGVFGFGSTPEQATIDWDRRLAERIKLAGPNDGFIDEVNKNLREYTFDHNSFLTEEKRPNDGPPHTATNDRREGFEEGVPSVPPHRRNTTDQSNSDGSE